MDQIKNLLSRLSDQRGQTMAEYAVVLAVITVVVVFALTTLTGAISAALDAVTAILP
jgi:Flp pilus assembly pilin Flp